MTLVVDAGPLVAMADERSELGGRCHALIIEERGDVIVSAYAAAEADHLIGKRLGREAERAFLRDLASGVYRVEAMTTDEHALALELDEELPGLGLADLSIVVLAARHRTKRILTFDVRDFRRARPLDGGWFEILPAM